METSIYDGMSRASLARMIRKYNRCNVEVPDGLREAYNTQQRIKRRNHTPKQKIDELERRRRSRAREYKRFIERHLGQLRRQLMRLDQHDVSKLREIADFVNGLLRKHDNPPEDLDSVYTDKTLGAPEQIDWSNPIHWERIKRSETYLSVLRSLKRTFRTFEDWMPWGVLVSEWGMKNVCGAIERVQPTQRWPQTVEDILRSAKARKDATYNDTNQGVKPRQLTEDERRANAERMKQLLKRTE